MNKFISLFLLIFLVNAGYSQELEDDYQEAREMLKELTSDHLTLQFSREMADFSPMTRFTFYNQSHPFKFRVHNHLKPFGKAKFIIKKVVCGFKYVNKLGRDLPDGSKGYDFGDSITYRRRAVITADKKDCVRKAGCFVTVGIKDLPDENDLPYLMDVTSEPELCIASGKVNVHFD